MADALTSPIKKTEGAKPKEIEVLKQMVIEGSNEHIYLSQEFEIDKKYMFELAITNLEREKPIIDARTNRVDQESKFKPYQNIILSSQIVWKGQRRNLRYYDGCDTIFQDEQPKEKDLIDQLIKQTQRRAFLQGKFGVNGDEKMLLLYLNMCSWNADSPFRTRSANAIFVPIDKTKKARQTEEKLEQMEKALKLSKEADERKMLIHAQYLEIPTEDWDSNNPLTPAEIRGLYREEAINNPKRFIDSYGNKAVELTYYIKKGLMEGAINTKLNPNKAYLGNKEICDISGLSSHEAILQKLVEFSQLEDGEEFATQIKALYKD